MKKHTANKAVFLDRDGTIIINRNYISSPNSVRLKKGVSHLAKLSRYGFKLIVITNQSGIARGLLTEEQLNKVNEKMLTRLKKYNVYIDDIFFCPHHPYEAINPKYKKNCRCRKPGTLLFEKASKKHQIDMSKSFFIGDSPVDGYAGIDLHIPTILLKYPKDKDEFINNSNIFYQNNIESAVNFILRYKNE